MSQQFTSSSIDFCYTNLDPALIGIIIHKNYAGLSRHHGVVCILENSTLELGLSRKQTKSITTEKLK